jgi:putative transcriptional regulator
MDSLRGQLLLASRRLADPNFFHAVVLMVQHGEDGALGLVINRPLEVTIKQACDDSLEMVCETEGILHQGGPCQGPLMVLH